MTYVDNAQTRLEFVGPVNEFGNRQALGFFRNEEDTLLLPVELGVNFGVLLTNHAGHMVAYPAFTGRGGRRIRNIFVHNDQLDPNLLPGDGGMMEVGEYGSEYCRAVFDGFKLPGNRKQEFVVQDGDGGIGDDGVDELLFYRRTRPGVVIAQVLGGGAPGARAISVPGPRIGAAEVTADGRKLTGLDYEQDADPNVPIFRVKIVYGEAVAALRS